MRMSSRQRTILLRLMLFVVLANYLAQIPYYLRLYYFPHGVAPSWSGTALLALTLAWFAAGYLGVVRGWSAAYWVLLAYFVTVVTFYLRNMLTQVTHGYPPFMHLQARDPILFMVFGIGYVNLLAGIAFLYVLVRYRPTFVDPRPAATGRG